MPREPKKPHTKISEIYNPAEWTYQMEVGTDGYTTIRFDNGAVVEYPPFPADEVWRERKARNMCAISYQILARVAAEKRDEHE